MGHLTQHLEQTEQQKGFGGWLKRKLFGWVCRTFAATEQDLAVQQHALEELRQQCTEAQQQLMQLQQQCAHLRQDFEQSCVNLRNNNDALASLRSEMDCVKIQQRQVQRQKPAEASSTVPEPSAPAVSAAPEHTYQAIEYFDFENHFRGSVEHVKTVQQQYLPYFIGKQHVLDLGCGRGEFLSLMQENGIPAEGVDIYAPYIDYCTMQGLKAVCGDGMAYLAQMQQVDGIFVGQVVEHLTPAQILELCHTAYEKLTEGGCLIIETPNPTSLSIYTNAFYIDPSHVKPVHPLTMQYYLEKAGFRQTELIYTENSRPPQTIPALRCEGENVDAFNSAMQQVAQMLYGSQDYAIVAVR